MKKLIVLLVVALFAVPAMAYVPGDIVWESYGYELDAATPDGTGDYDPADYRIADRDPASIHVVENPETQVQVQTVVVRTGENALRITGGAEEIWIGHGAAPDGPGAQDFYHKFSILVPNGAAAGMQYGKRNSATSNVALINMKFDGGYIQQYASGWQQLAPYTAGVWQDYVVQWIWATQTFDIWQNDIKVSENVLVGNPGASWVNNIANYLRAGDAFYLDDVSVVDGVYVPEPATMALLALGLPLLRRKK